MNVTVTFWIGLLYASVSFTCISLRKPPMIAEMVVLLCAVKSEGAAALTCTSASPVAVLVTLSVAVTVCAPAVFSVTLKV